MPKHVIMINPVRLLDKQRGEEFVAVWRKTAETFSKEPGFLGVKLQKSVEPGADFEYVNLAYWESAEACYAALAKHPNLTSKDWSSAPIEAHFAIYEQYGEYEQPEKLAS